MYIVWCWKVKVSEEKTVKYWKDKYNNMCYRAVLGTAFGTLFGCIVGTTVSCPDHEKHIRNAKKEIIVKENNVFVVPDKKSFPTNALNLD